MKTLIKTIFVAIFATILFNANANAQWKTTFHEGDELKGTPSYYSNLYTDGENAFVCWDNDDEIKIVAGRGIFDYDDNYVTAIVGFYVDGTLIDKVTTKFFVPKGDSDTAYTSSYRVKGLGRRIIEHLKTTGSVRILAAKYSGADFDLTIPMNPEIK